MHRKMVLGFVLGGWVIWAFPGLALAGEPQEKRQSQPHDHAHAYGEGHGHQEAHGEHADGDSEGMAQMMEAFMMLASPGEHHEHMRSLAGKWDIKGKFRMAPDAPWSESNSVSEADWILGGRFLTQKVKGEPMMGMPMAFEGFGIMGYDNMTRKHTYVWMDNFGTMFMTGEGLCAENGKILTFMSTFLDPMSGQESFMRSVYRVESPERYVLQMYGPDQKGDEFLSMELVHTRKK